LGNGCAFVLPLHTMSATPLISIILPAYNAEGYLTEAIQSVLAQKHTHLELLVINDGSTDGTAAIVQGFSDPRIRYFEQKNGGVSAARNVGLANMKGDCFCFLDADDRMPPDSLSSRLAVLQQHPACAFVGGAQEQRNADLSEVLLVQRPSYTGHPRAGLIRLDHTCFINCGTWLIKRASNHTYAFPEDMTHAEDVAFFLSISDQGTLYPTAEIAQIYRRHASAMSNLDGLWRGYIGFYAFALSGGYLYTEEDKMFLQKKIRRIMFRSYARAGNMRGALRALTYSFS